MKVAQVILAVSSLVVAVAGPFLPHSPLRSCTRR